jgi:hypothetical protein
MNNIKCPIDGCPGFFTTSGRPNLGNHIQSSAKKELFANFILKELRPTPHADYVAKNIKRRYEEVVVCLVDGKPVIIYV